MPPLQLVENPDILATISKLPDRRPPLVIGFAAETEHLIDNAKAKLARKGCDWIVANDVSPASGVMGGDRNTVHLLTRDGGDINVDSWPVMTKDEVAAALVARIVQNSSLLGRQTLKIGLHGFVAADELRECDVRRLRLPLDLRRTRRLRPDSRG